MRQGTITGREVLFTEADREWKRTGKHNFGRIGVNLSQSEENGLKY